MFPQSRPWWRPLSIAIVALICLTDLAARQEARSAEPGRKDTTEPLASARPAGNPHAFETPRLFVPTSAGVKADLRYTLFGTSYRGRFGASGATFDVPDPNGHGVSVSLQFVGARGDLAPVGARPTSGKINLLRGERAQWRANLPTYEELVYPDAWPGIDAAFLPEARRVKYEFRLEPGADPSAIRFSYRGAESVRLAPDGALEIQTPAGIVRDEAPRSYQRVGDRRVHIPSRFVVSRMGEVSVAVGRYDRRLPLIVDPGLVFATYVGGRFTEDASSVVLDPAGNVYIAGLTYSDDFPATAIGTRPYNAYYVTKLDPTGSRLVYSTLLPLGALNSSLGRATLAVDQQGHAYVAGNTGDRQAVTASFGPDALSEKVFVAKLSPDGSSLVYNVLVGGSGGSAASAITVDATGAAYVTGRTSDTDFPTTAGAFDRTFGGGNDNCCPPYDPVVFKLNPSGTELAYSTYLGGTPGTLSGQDEGVDIAVDAGGNAFVTGLTSAADFPTTPGAYGRTVSHGRTIFVTKLNAGGSGLAYSTVLGAHVGIDFVYAIAVGSAGDAYVAGQTTATDLPVTAGAVQATNLAAQTSSPYTGFLVRVDPSGASLLYATYLGGNGNSGLTGVALGPGEAAYVTGSAAVGFPTTPNGLRRTAPAGDDTGVVAVIDADAGRLVYGTYLPATTPTSIAADAGGDAIVSGGAEAGMTTTPAAYPRTLASGVNNLGDAFIARIIPATDLAATRPATSSSQENSALSAANAVDGNFATRWSSQFSDPQWIAVDLGLAAAVHRVVLHWETAFASSYRIEGSSDGTNWSTLATVNGGNGGVDDVEVSGTARYVRVLGTQRATPWGYSLWEVAVFGVPSGGAANSPPTVSLTSPANGATFEAGSILTLAATASDPDGSVSRVDFLANGTQVGSDDAAPFTVQWGGVAAGSYTLTAVATDNLGATKTSTPITISVGAPSGNGLPAGWAHADIGNAGIPGDARYTAATGAFNVWGAGADIWGTADSFHFVYMPLDGDGQLIARVTAIQNTHTFAKAGLMIRESLTPGSRHVLVNLRPNNGLELLQRSDTGGQTWLAGAGTASGPPPIWFKLIRTGNRIDTYMSFRGGPDPGDWTGAGSTYTAMGSRAYVGLAVTSHDPSVLNQSVFDNVAITVGPPPSGALPAPWSAQDVGSVGLNGQSTYSAGTFTARGSGADIWGAADGFHYVSQPVTGDVQLVARVTGVQNTNPYAKAGLMMRETTAAGARHVIIDVRPNGSVEFMTRTATGGATTYIAGASRPTPAWLRLTRSGSTVTGAVSADGTSWTTVGSTSTTMPASVRIGLAVTSHDNTLLNTSTFDNVALTGGGAPPPAGDIVIYAADVPAGAVRGSWTLAADTTSPQGMKLATPDNGVANTNAPLAAPVDYVDVVFNANAGTPYRLWLRMKAANNSKYNDALWVQFSDARASGSPVFAIGSTSGLLVNLATDGTASSLNGWGWQNAAYWLSQPTTFTFATTGTHTLRLQVREDGVQIDQIVLSPAKYLSTPPGPATNDTTIVQR